MKPGEGMYECHLPCPAKGCNGNIIFTGLKDGIKMFKCCICEKEFPNRRTRSILVERDRRG